MSLSSNIAANLGRIREQMAQAAAAADRSLDEITLVGISKYVGPGEVAELAAAGCFDLGESRPQELWKKAGDPLLAAGNIRWHLVGHLQRNKVRRTLPLLTMIHSIDSEQLLATIHEELARMDREAEPSTGGASGTWCHSKPLSVLLEVNTSGEAAKHGLVPDQVEPLLATAPRYTHVAIRGLMTMAALEGGPEVAARNFASLRALRDRLRCLAPDCVRLDELSMGMSGDFEVAIREGATIVRIGSLLWE